MELLCFLLLCLQQHHRGVKELWLLQEVVAVGAVDALGAVAWAVLPGLQWLLASCT